MKNMAEDPVSKDPEDPWAEAEGLDGDPAQTVRDADATAMLPPAKAGTAKPKSAPSKPVPAKPVPASGDATVKLPGKPPARPEPARPEPADRTAVMPPAEDVWTGRAGVPEPAAGGTASPETGYVMVQPGRTWLAPLLIGLIVLVLVAMIGFGVWLAVSSEEPAPEPTTSPTAAASSSPSPEASAPPSASPSVSPSATDFVLPASLIGLTAEQAKDLLEGERLAVETESRPDGATAGTVIDVVPSIGTPVAEGSTVKLIIAAPLPPSPEPSPPAESPSPSPGPSA